ncbi:Cleavage stimulation factor subunit 77 [Nymphaea thermarum]|nr:Cleavage stimulation factor subunit 77 [Nymphaea thermarum]
MHEPGYILEYADFLCRLNDDRNVRALFERALSLLPPEESVEVEQRRKEALSSRGEDSSSSLESSLYDVVSRYSFMDLWPCSSRDLDHLARIEWLAKNINRKGDKTTLPYETGSSEKNLALQAPNSKTGLASTKVIYPDVSKMVIYDPRQKPGAGLPPNATVPGLPIVSASTSLTNSLSSVGNGTSKTPDEMLKVMSPALVTFIAHLPVVEGPSPNVDIVLSILAQCNFPTGATGKSTRLQHQSALGPVQSTTNDLAGPAKSWSNANSSSARPQSHAGKRRDSDRQDDDEITVQSQPLQRDIFRLRQMRRARGLTSSQTGSASVGSGAISGEPSGSSG